jgi:myosin-crossreactive antigen
LKQVVSLLQTLKEDLDNSKVREWPFETYFAVYWAIEMALSQRH